VKRIKLAFLLPATFALAACGGDSGFAEESAEEILKAAIKDTKSLEDVNLAGTINNEGTEITLDMNISGDGSCQGTVGGDALGEFEILSTEEVTYLKADAEVLGQLTGLGDAELFKEIGDKWFEVPGGNGSFSQLCDLDELLADFDEDSINPDAKKGETSEIDGVEVIEIKDPGKDGETGAVFVATEGEHYVVRISGPDDEGSVTLSEFNEGVNVEKPSDDEIFDLSSVGG
jgi:hypothetical protein